MITGAEILHKENGFIYSSGKINRLFIWEDIIKITAYKVDLITIDEVRLDILDNNGSITIGEEHNFWGNFIIKLSEQYSEIDTKWFSKIVKPTFENNETILYQKK